MNRSEGVKWLPCKFIMGGKQEDCKRYIRDKENQRFAEFFEYLIFLLAVNAMILYNSNDIPCR